MDAGARRVHTAKAAATGALLSGANPKNLLLVVAGAASIAGAGLDGGDEAVVFGVFALIATVGVGTPVVLSAVLGDRARAMLDGLKDWLAANNAVIMAVLLLVLGAKVLGDAISGLSA
ncbi:MAG TPA: GAP family protein [Solirubrobacteraceae bacterium]|nr:GAP family protein [Solirubrobacteraceae bacterium]